MTTEYQFDTQDEIDVFIESMFENEKNISADDIKKRAERYKFADEQVKNRFIQTGIKRLNEASK